MAESTSVWRQFPRSFWIANLMEISERMGWYGFFAVSTLYLTNAVADGGLGFTSQDRGVIQGLATFFLYLFPAVFGALADRYGYRRMFLASAVVMAPAYILLVAPRTFWGFLGVYFLVAVGHGMFKPVVISTVAKSTNEKTGSMGFGIFYMMVNIGGFLGPIVAGVVRGWDWKYVFWASSGWIVVMGLTCLLLYREPPRDVETESRRTLRDVFSGMIEVVGNGRFFLLLGGLLLLLVMGSKWLEPREFLPAQIICKLFLHRQRLQIQPQRRQLFISHVCEHIPRHEFRIERSAGGGHAGAHHVGELRLRPAAGRGEDGNVWTGWNAWLYRGRAIQIRPMTHTTKGDGHQILSVLGCRTLSRGQADGSVMVDHLGRDQWHRLRVKHTEGTEDSA